LVAAGPTVSVERIWPTSHGVFPLFGWAMVIVAALGNPLANIMHCDAIVNFLPL